MNAKIRSIIMITLLASLSLWKATIAFAGQPISLSPKDFNAYFPLAKGAYWVYNGKVKWTKGTEVMEKAMTWKMEVVDVIERQHVTGYLLKGHPADLAWYQEGKERSDYLILRVGPGRYYESHRKDIPDRLKDEGDLLQDIVRESELFLDVPLFSGKVFGESKQITRLDGFYYWVVDEEQQVELNNNVKGILSIANALKYSLSFRTMPDHTVIEFVPGVGITRFVYAHHGTVSECDMKLIEYHPGNE